MNEYDPKFKIGDVVCSRPKIKSEFFGESKVRLTDIVPYKVTDIYKDDGTNVRNGEPGDCHSYRLEEIGGYHTINKFQYELMYWKDIKDQVLVAYKEKIDKLQEI